jgi:hypothetical protein
MTGAAAARLRRLMKPSRVKISRESQMIEKPTRRVVEKG